MSTSFDKTLIGIFGDWLSLVSLLEPSHDGWTERAHKDNNININNQC